VQPDRIPYGLFNIKTCANLAALKISTARSKH
jgi:hypothetical protein